MSEDYIKELEKEIFLKEANIEFLKLYVKKLKKQREKDERNSIS